MAPMNNKAEDSRSRRGGNRRALTPVETHLIAAGGEFVGTFLFLYFAYAGNLMAASRAATAAPIGGMSSETVIFISLAYSFSLLVNVWAFYRISGGVFNPAVRFNLGFPIITAEVFKMPTER
jgi:aquaporin related protein